MRADKMQITYFRCSCAHPLNQSGPNLVYDSAILVYAYLPNFVALWAKNLQISSVSKFGILWWRLAY